MVQGHLESLLSEGSSKNNNAEVHLWLSQAGLWIVLQRLAALAEPRLQPLEALEAILGQSLKPKLLRQLGSASIGFQATPWQHYLWSQNVDMFQGFHPGNHHACHGQFTILENIQNRT